MTTDKESNGMLNLLTLTINDKEIQDEYNQHKARIFFFWAWLTSIFSFLAFGVVALNYWVFN